MADDVEAMYLPAECPGCGRIYEVKFETLYTKDWHRPVEIVQLRGLCRCAQCGTEWQQCWDKEISDDDA